MKLAVISDTHGCLRDAVKTILYTCDVILHCGDIDNQHIVTELKNIAPLYAVRGNADKAWAEYLPYTSELEFCGIKILMIHNKKHITPEMLKNKDLILYGHSHKYDQKIIDDITWLNPGSCGKRRFSLPLTMSVITITNNGFNVEKIEFGNTEENLLSTNDINIDVVKNVIRCVDKGKSVAETAKKCKLPLDLTEHLCRLYLTHPGVDAEGIMIKIGK